MNSELEVVRSNFNARFDDPGVELAYEVAGKSPELPKESKRTRMRRSYYKVAASVGVMVAGSLKAEPYYSTRRENPESLELLDHVVGNSSMTIAMASGIAVVYFLSEAGTIYNGRSSSTAALHSYLFKDNQ